MTIVGPRKTTLIIRFKTPQGWERADAARGANGRIRPGYALIDGNAEKVSNYNYHIRYYEHRRLKYVPAGTNANEAETQRRRIEQQTTVKAEALKAGVKVEVSETRKTLARTAAEYVRDAEQRNANEAAAQARTVTAEFIPLVKKTYVDEVTRQDVLRFHAALRKRGCSDRTVANKHNRLASWLRFAGADNDALPPTPKYEEKLPTIYTSDQISSILGAADDYMRLAIGLALKCGLREQELIFVRWQDIDEDAKVIRVCGKDEHGFRVKDYEQREIPVPDELLAELKSWKEKHSGKSLVLGTTKGHPNHKLLRTLKRLAKRAGLNCGHCRGCKRAARECQNWTLHKFRRTYCTTLLRSNFDLRTVQAYAGHADLESTMRYLRPATSNEVRTKLKKVQW